MSITKRRAATSGYQRSDLDLPGLKHESSPTDPIEKGANVQRSPKVCNPW
jgi:hypothetical protein